LPLSLLEALAHGTPALVSPAVERAVPVAARGAGWVCDPSNVGQTLQEIESTGEEERLRRGIAAVALSRDYQWHAVGSRLVRLYENVAAKKS
jgi:glycosyltransferase involved in cell wall biosynthesis